MDSGKATDIDMLPSRQSISQSSLQNLLLSCGPQIRPLHRFLLLVPTRYYSLGARRLLTHHGLQRSVALRVEVQGLSAPQVLILP